MHTDIYLHIQTHTYGHTGTHIHTHRHTPTDTDYTLKPVRQQTGSERLPAALPPASGMEPESQCTRTEQSKAEEPEASNQAMADTANGRLKPLRFAAVQTEVKSQREAEQQEQRGCPYRFTRREEQ